MITSLPVSVLSNARKRNISSELISGSQDRPQDLMINPSLLQEATIPALPHAGPVVTGAAGGGAGGGGETAQEKKWNAEFNQVLQTVIEQERVSKSSMDWTTGNLGGGLAEQKTAKEPVMDWCSGVSKAPDCLPATTPAPVLAIPEPEFSSESQAVFCPTQEVAGQETGTQQAQSVDTNNTQGQLLFEVRTLNSMITFKQ